jgi:hypothetical protein
MKRHYREHLLPPTPCPICKETIATCDTVFDNGKQIICLACRIKQTTQAYIPEPYNPLWDTDHHFPAPGTQVWKKAFLKALGNPKFKYSLPEISFEELPEKPEKFKHKYQEKEYAAKVKRIEKDNNFKQWLVAAVEPYQN